MRLAWIIASSLAGGLAGGAARADAPAAVPTGAAFAGDSVRLALRDRVTVSYPGATAVFSIDATVAEPSVSGGQIAIVARAVEVRLDGGRAVVSDASGRFVFEDVASGDHRVDAEVPDGMYFTGPSRVTVSAGDAVQFGVARAAAYLSGHVLDDRGAGGGGVSIVLRGGVLGDHTATTDSSGHFRFAVDGGDYMLDPVSESIPPGYDVAAAMPRSVQLSAGAPAQTELVVPANRSIAGTLRDPRIASGTASIRIVELDRSAAIDSDGRYAFRGVPPGSYTIEAIVGGTAMRHTVEVPVGPAVVRGVDLP